MNIRRLGCIFGIVFFVFSSLLMGQSQEKLTSRLCKVLASDSAHSTVVAWIYFTDKGIQTPEKFQKVQAGLTDRSLKRRHRTRGSKPLIDVYDLPVEPTYIRQIAREVHRIRHKSRWLNAISVEASPQSLKEISKLPFVKKIDLVNHWRLPLPEPKRAEESFTSPLDGNLLNYGASFTQNELIDIPPLHNLGLDGSGVLICMLDAGFNNLEHEAFSRLDIVATWDFANGDSIVSDEPGQLGSGSHGTYTLGTIAGYAPGNLIGPAYGASFLLAKTEITNFERNIEEDNWVAGAEWADSLGADIISSSLGYRQFDSDQNSYTWEDMDGNTTVTTIAADIAASRGILVVNSVGNEGSLEPQNTLVAPSDGDSVLAVGAVDSQGIRVDFSSVGPTADGRIKPDVMAMGVHVLVPSAVNPTGYHAVSGTSFSCPLVSGAAALIMQAHPEWTNMQVFEALRNTASNASAPNNLIGWGIIDAFQAANYVTGIDDKPPTVVSEFKLYPAFPNPFNPGTTIRYSLPRSNVPVNLSIYNSLGQKITVLVDKVQNGGIKEVTWRPAGLASGVYYIVLKALQQQRVQKVIFIR